MNNEVSTCKPECTVPAATESSEAWARPHYEADRDSETYRLRVYVPGSNKSNVNLSVEEGLLTVNAKRSDTPDENWKPLSLELSRRDYRLEVRIPEKVDVSAIGAKVEDGILLLTLPIREADKPRSIEIS